MFTKIWKEKLQWILVLIMLLLCIYGCHNLNMRVTTDKVNKKVAHVVIDPGHGGSDPGKMGLNRTIEKEINLKIAKKVRKKLEEQEVMVTMTREKDEGVMGEASVNGKIKDMRKRVEIINEAKPQLTVSIHQNSYSDEAVRGPQVFYYTHSEEGKKVAQIVQKELHNLDPEHKRTEAANDDYYIFRHTKFPVIIVECGFLSNPEESRKLAEKEYQNMVAEAITRGIMAAIKSQK